MGKGRPADTIPFPPSLGRFPRLLGKAPSHTRWGEGMRLARLAVLAVPCPTCRRLFYWGAAKLNLLALLQAVLTRFLLFDKRCINPVPRCLPCCFLRNASLDTHTSHTIREPWHNTSESRKNRIIERNWRGRHTGQKKEETKNR